MNRQFNESNRVVLTSEQIEWYVAHARQLRNEVILHGLKQAFSRLGIGFRRAVAWLGDVFRCIGAREPGAHRPC